MAAGNSYLFLGPEIGERQDAVRLIRQNLGPDTEEISFYGGENPVSHIVSILRNPSLFAPARLILVKAPEVIKKKEEIDLLASYVESPADDTVLILVSDETSLDKRIEAAFPPKNKRIFWELFENRKVEWIRNFFRREGYTIDGEAVETLLGMVENNTDALRRECSRLMLFAGKEKSVGADDVEKWLSHSREESSFSLFGRISRGELEASLQTAQSLIAGREAPEAIIAGLNWCFHRLRDYKSLVSKGQTGDVDFRKIGLGGSRVRRDYELAAARYTPAQLDRVIALLAEYDLLLRSSGGLRNTLFDVLVWKIVRPSP